MDGNLCMADDIGCSKYTNPESLASGHGLLWGRKTIRLQALPKLKMVVGESVFWTPKGKWRTQGMSANATISISSTRKAARVAAERALSEFFKFFRLLSSEIQGLRVYSNTINDYAYWALYTKTHINKIQSTFKNILQKASILAEPKYGHDVTLSISASRS